MLLILDSNEYIFGLGSMPDPTCAKLLDTMLEHAAKIAIRVPRLITEEVRNNLTPEAFKEFILFIHTFTTIDEDKVIPFELGAKYEDKGLKPADALIAAYAEWIGADFLVSENRHFLSRQSTLPFKIINAEHCLKLI